MTNQELVDKLLKNADLDNTAVVRLVYRDEDGTAIGERVVPISFVTIMSEICIEASSLGVTLREGEKPDTENAT